ncbi:MAG: hypothetical protein ACTSP2_06500 [Alphaproteobacteria bacterium]
MLTLLWLFLFLFGIAAIILISLVVDLIRFLFGRSRRLPPPRRRRQAGLGSLFLRLMFFAVALELLISGMASSLLGAGREIGSCSMTGSSVFCEGFAGAGALGGLLSLPAWLADQTNLLLAVIRAPSVFFADGLASLPVPPAELAMGLVGPVVLLLAWLGFVLLLRDVRRLWSSRD